MVGRMKTCVLWSGGKDCFASLLLAAGGSRPDPRQFVLATFAPRGPAFRCHPISIMRQQARALGLDHHVLTVDPQRWRDDYRRGFRSLVRAHRVQHLVSGDREVLPWLTEESAACGLDVHAPLVERPRPDDVFSVLARYGVTTTVSGLREDFYGTGLLGRPIDLAVLDQLGLTDDPSFDPCGERGEYHTIVTHLRGMALHEGGLSSLPHELERGVWALRFASRAPRSPLARDDA